MFKTDRCDRQFKSVLQLSMGSACVHTQTGIPTSSILLPVIHNSIFRKFVIVGRSMILVILTSCTNFGHHIFELELSFFSKLGIIDFCVHARSLVLVIELFDNSCLLLGFPIVCGDSPPFCLSQSAFGLD